MSSETKTGPAATGPSGMKLPNEIELFSPYNYTSDAADRASDIFGSPAIETCAVNYDWKTALCRIAHRRDRIIMLEKRLLSTVLTCEVSTLHEVPRDMCLLGPNHQRILKTIREIDPSGAAADICRVWIVLRDEIPSVSLIISDITSCSPLFPERGFIADICDAITCLQLRHAAAAAAAEALEKSLEDDL